MLESGRSRSSSKGAAFYMLDQASGNLGLALRVVTVVWTQRTVHGVLFSLSIGSIAFGKLILQTGWSSGTTCDNSSGHCSQSGNQWHPPFLQAEKLFSHASWSLDLNQGITIVNYFVLFWTLKRLVPLIFPLSFLERNAFLPWVQRDGQLFNRVSFLMPVL